MYSRLFSFLRRLFQKFLLSHLPGTSLVWGPPRRYRASAIDNLQKSSADYFEVYPPNKFRRTEASTCELRVPAVFKNASIEHTPSYGVFVLRNGRVYGSEPAVISSDDSVLLDISMQWAPFHAEVFRQWSLPKLKFFDGPVLVLAGTPGGNYSHWFQQMLPRLHLAKSAGYQLSDFSAFVINSGGPFIEQSLQLLEVPIDRCLFTNHDLHVQGSPLVVPSIPSPGNPSAWVPEFLRSSFWPRVESRKLESPKRIYISRSKAGSRRVSNEIDLIPLLEEKGFTLLCLEDHSLQHQIEFFANADVICGVHGSGLTNVLFCRPGCTLIEIYHPQFPEIFWWSLASVSQVNYYFMLGEGQPVDFVDMSQNFPLNHLDVVCDTAKLRSTFELAGV